MELNLTVVGNHCMYVWKLETKFESAAVLKVTFTSTETVLLEHLGHGDKVSIDYASTSTSNEIRSYFMHIWQLN